MIPPSGEMLREARAAWAEEAGRAIPRPTEAALLVAIVVTTDVAVALIAPRLAALLDGRPLAIATTYAVAVLLGSMVTAAPLRLLLVARDRASRAAHVARSRRGRTTCTRCAGPVVAREPNEVGARECGTCGARLLEASGLLIHEIEDPRWRRRRWRAAARARLGAHPPRPSPWLSPFVWLGASAGALVALVGTAAALGAVSPHSSEALDARALGVVEPAETRGALAPFRAPPRTDR